jgi:hypothetical protein
MLLGGTYVRLFYHVIFLAAIRILLEEARQFLIKGAMHSLRQ